MVSVCIVTHVNVLQEVDKLLGVLLASRMVVSAMLAVKLFSMRSICLHQLWGLSIMDSGIASRCCVLAVTASATTSRALRCIEIERIGISTSTEKITKLGCT